MYVVQPNMRHGPPSAITGYCGFCNMPRIARGELHLGECPFHNPDTCLICLDDVIVDNAYRDELS